MPAVRASARGDELVDVAGAGRDFGPQLRVGVVVASSLAGGVGSSRGGELAAMDDPDRRLGAHHADLGLRPGEHVVGAEVLGVHRDESSPERLAQNHRHARHGRLGERMDECSAEADHARGLLAGARHEAGRVDEYEQRDPEGVALGDEARALLRAGGVEHAAEVARLVGDHPDRFAPRSAPSR